MDKLIRSEELLTQTLDIKHRFYASSAEPLTHKELLEAAKCSGDKKLIDLYNDHSLGYAENGGSLDLREEIATLYNDSIKPENIVVFPGAQTGMTLTAMALLRKGDHAIIVTPSYQSLEESVRYAGAEVTRIPLSPKDNWQLNFSAIEGAIQSNTKYIVLNDPHNPSGALLTKNCKMKLISIAERNNCLIFSDEVYRLMELDPEDRSESMAELTKYGLSLSTMSKPWGGGGMSIGWIVSKNKSIIEKLLKAQHMFAVSVSRAGEIQAMMAIKSREKIIARNMNIISENIALLDEMFEKYDDLLEWERPKAGGTAFVKFKGNLTGTELSLQLLEKGILVFGPDIFDCNEELEQYFRIGFSRSTMPEALKAFTKFLDTLK
ncbi:pyridoxal phosphate-dependent aminotransferase [Emcibacteraceae bacterium]|nr:pyridoxal phosphate-dependent aminotransferase [Emcibacteraceae bacterium]